MGFHKDSQRGDIHGSHQWTYANLTDRDNHNPSEGPTAALTAEDVLQRRQCWVESELSFYVLLNHSPISWGPVGGAAAPHSHANKAELDKVVDGDHDVRTDNPHDTIMYAFFEADFDTNVSNQRVRQIAGTGAFRFPFAIPADAKEILSVRLLGFPTAAFTDENIELTAEYGQRSGEPYNQHVETDLTSLYSGAASQNFAWDIKSKVLTAVAAGDAGGVFVDHKGIGTSVNYRGIEVRYK